MCYHERSARVFSRPRKYRGACKTTAVQARIAAAAATAGDEVKEGMVEVPETVDTRGVESRTADIGQRNFELIFLPVRATSSS